MPLAASTHLSHPGSQAPVQAVSSKFDTLQSTTPTETSWYLVRLTNESLSFSQDRASILSEFSHTSQSLVMFLLGRTNQLHDTRDLSPYMRWLENIKMAMVFVKHNLHPRHLTLSTLPLQYFATGCPCERYFKPAHICDILSRMGFLCLTPHIPRPYCYAFHVLDATTAVAHMRDISSASYSASHRRAIPPLGRPYMRYFEPHGLLAFDVPHSPVVVRVPDPAMARHLLQECICLEWSQL
ncbi:hypothetical protein EDD15DRAFT_2198800 [Pisolithus albus]|nr:hypothetical protein EDD15DRAFT_2198800 [Pisolithus albus]